MYACGMIENRCHSYGISSEREPFSVVTVHAVLISIPLLCNWVYYACMFVDFLCALILAFCIAIVTCVQLEYLSQGGETPADVAIRMGHVKVVDALLQSGIDISIDKKVS